MLKQRFTPAYISGLISDAADLEVTAELPAWSPPAPLAPRAPSWRDRLSLRANWARRRWSALWRRETALTTTAVLPAVRL